MLRVTLQTLLLLVGLLLRELRGWAGGRRSPDLAGGGGVLLLDAGLALRVWGLAARELGGHFGLGCGVGFGLLFRCC